MIWSPNSGHMFSVSFVRLLIGLYGCIISSMLPNMEKNILLCGILFHSLICIYHTYYLVPDNIQLLTDLTISHVLQLINMSQILSLFNYVEQAYL